MLEKIKSTIALLAGSLFILCAVGYLVVQLFSLNRNMNRVVSMDIPSIKTTLEKSAEKAESIKTDISGISDKINDYSDRTQSITQIEKDVGVIAKKITEEVATDLNRIEGESAQHVDAVRMLSEKIDTLSLQYVKFFRLAEDKITVSIPPKWIDALPQREGTIFSLGLSPSTSKLTNAQQAAVTQARVNLATLLESKTIRAMGRIIASAGKTPPQSIDDFSEQFRAQLTKAIDELLEESQVESYWVGPMGYVYALVSFPLDRGIEGTRFGMLVDTLKLMHQSITGSQMKDFERQLKVELLK